MPRRWLECLALFSSYLGVLGVLTVAFGMIGRVLPVRSLHISVLVALLGGGCAGHARTNPSFDLTAPAARGALRQMAASPRRLERPVVVLGGFGDPGVAPNYLAGEVRKLTGDRRVLPVSFGFWESLDDCRARVIRDVGRAFPCDDSEWTREVDVIAVSLGGVVARHAAAAPPAPSGRRLRVARLFTISSPHRGAAVAALPAIPFMGGLQTDLRRGSKFLRSLEQSEQPAAYPVYPYVRLGDSLVGAANAAPYGQDPWWVATPPLEGPHTFAYCDARIVADIVRRLRGEEPFAKEPPEPLPGRHATAAAPASGPSPRPSPLGTGERG